MVHEGSADDDIGGDLEWTSSGFTMGSGGWSVGGDDVGEGDGVSSIEVDGFLQKGVVLLQKGVVIVSSTPVGGSAGCAGGGGVWSGAVLGLRRRGGAQVVAILWS